MSKHRIKLTGPQHTVEIEYEHDRCDGPATVVAEKIREAVEAYKDLVQLQDVDYLTSSDKC